MMYRFAHCLLLAVTLSWVWGVGSVHAVQDPALMQEKSNVAPIPYKPVFNHHKVTLGEQLFYDPALSGNKKVSCATCHDLTTLGAIPGKRYSFAGADGKVLPINVPSIFNTAYHYVYSWDGRLTTAEKQIEESLLHPSKMGTNWEVLLRYIRNHPRYYYMFTSIYGRDVTKHAVVDVLKTYKNSLMTPRAPFDRYLKGEIDILSDSAKNGFLLFKKYGCVACHHGTGLGGDMMASLSVVEKYAPSDNYLSIVRVPSLRNVTKTPPYFHDGSVETLDEVLKIKEKYMLGRTFSGQERRDILSFLESLTAPLVKEE